jgi:hypothetical protein
MSGKGRGTPYPEDFQPNDNNMLNAQRWGLNLMDQVEAFSDYHQSKGSRFLKWNLALNTWMRNAYERRESKFGRPAVPIPQAPDLRYSQALESYLLRPPLRRQ